MPPDKIMSISFVVYRLGIATVMETIYNSMFLSLLNIVLVKPCLGDSCYVDLKTGCIKYAINEATPIDAVCELYVVKLNNSLVLVFVT